MGRRRRQQIQAVVFVGTRHDVPDRAIRHRLEEGLPAEVELRYVGRPWRASPSEGYPTAHLLEQDRIAREALAAY